MADSLGCIFRDNLGGLTGAILFTAIAILHVGMFQLNRKSRKFVDEGGTRLAEEVRRAMSRSLSIVLIHENDPVRGGTAFSRRALAR